MYRYNVSVKSGTGGWQDDDGCDCNLGTLTTPFLPRINETLSIELDSKKINPATNKPFKVFVNFLVRDVEYWYRDNEHNGITVYVIPSEGYDYKS